MLDPEKPSHAIWLRLVDRRALRQNHPRLLVPRIEVRSRLQPRRIVKRAPPNDTRVVWRLRADLYPAAKAYPAVSAHPARLDAPAIGDAARSWLQFLSYQSERLTGNRYTNRERADCNTLAVGAVARINADGLLRNLIASSTA